MKRLRPVILVAVAVMMLGLIMPSSASAFRLYQVPPAEETVDDGDQAADAPIEEQQQSDPVDETQQVPQEQEQSEPPAQDPPADNTSDQDQQSEPMQIQAANTADPVVISADSVTCDGTFVVTFSGQADGEQVKLVWRDRSNGAVLSDYSINFPGAGTFTYSPTSAITVDSLVATAFMGEIGSGPGDSAVIDGCGTTTPPDPVDPPTISFDCTGLVVADVPGSNDGTVTLSVAVPGDPVVTFDSFSVAFTKPGIYSHTFDLTAAGNLDSYVATVLVDDHRVSTTITGCAPVIPDPVVITGDSLACDGTFVVTITGEAEPGTQMRLLWRDLSDGSALSNYLVPFPGPGQFTYTPDVAVSATNMIANAFIGDLNDGGPSGFARVEGCGTSTPADPAIESIAADCTGNGVLTVSDPVAGAVVTLMVTYHVPTGGSTWTPTGSEVDVTLVEGQTSYNFTIDVVTGVPAEANSIRIEVADTSGADFDGTTTKSPSFGPCGDNGTPSPTPDDGTPSPTPDDSTPSPTPDDGTPSPTPDDGTPSPTPDDGTPSPTPDNGTPSPTPDDGTPSPTPDDGTPTEEPTTEPTEEPEEKPTAPVVPDDDDQSPPSTDVEVNTMPDTGVGSTLASIPTNHPINPMLLIAAAVVLTFVAGVNLKRDLLGMVVGKVRK